MTLIADIQRHVGVEPDGKPGPLTWAAIAKALGITAATPAKHALRDPAAFYAGVRKVTGPLDQIQVEVINDLLTTAAHWPAGWMAYGLATAWHEARLKPIRELGGDAYLSKYDTGRLAAALGNTPEADGDGIRYAGRGLVQLTGLRNYQRAGAELGVPLAENPDLALQPGIAVAILVRGMEEGWFTGKKLADFITDRGSPAEFAAARRIINGVDRAALIAEHAQAFLAALDAGGWA